MTISKRTVLEYFLIQLLFSHITIINFTNGNKDASFCDSEMSICLEHLVRTEFANNNNH